MEYKKICMWLPTLCSIQQPVYCFQGRQTNFAEKLSVMDLRLSTEVAQVCNCIWSFYSRRLVIERLISKVASLVLPLNPCFVLLCFQVSFTCQQRICIANMQLFWSKRGHTFSSTNTTIRLHLINWLGHPLFFVQRRMRFLILGQSVGMRKKKLK